MASFYGGAASIVVRRGMARVQYLHAGKKSLKQRIMAFGQDIS